MVCYTTSCAGETMKESFRQIVLASFIIPFSAGLICKSACPSNLSLFNCTLNNSNCNFCYRSAYGNEYCTDNKPVPNLPLACVPEVRGVLLQCNTDNCNARTAPCPRKLSRWPKIPCLDSRGGNFSNVTRGEWCRISQFQGPQAEQAPETGLPIIGDVFVNLTGSQKSICYTDSVGNITECYCYGPLCNTQLLLSNGYRQIRNTSTAPKYNCQNWNTTDPSQPGPSTIQGHYCYSWYAFKKNSKTEYSQKLYGMYSLSRPGVFKKWTGCVNYYGVSRARFCYCTGNMCNVNVNGTTASPPVISSTKASASKQAVAGLNLLLISVLAAGKFYDA